MGKGDSCKGGGDVSKSADGGREGLMTALSHQFEENVLKKSTENSIEGGHMSEAADGGRKGIDWQGYECTVTKLKRLKGNCRREGEREGEAASRRAQGTIMKRGKCKSVQN